MGLGAVELVIVVSIGAAVAMTLITVAMLRDRPPKPSKPVKPQPAPAPTLSTDEVELLKNSTRELYTKAVNEAAADFHGDLQATSRQLNKLIIRLTTDVVERELEDYRKSLAEARAQALASLQNMQQAVEQKQKDLESDMDGEMAKRRQYLIERLDKRLGEAVAAYIVESLGQGADLGAQRAFLLESLERHKDDLKREIAGG